MTHRQNTERLSGQILLAVVFVLTSACDGSVEDREGTGDKPAIVDLKPGRWDVTARITLLNVSLPPVEQTHSICLGADRLLPELTELPPSITCDINQSTRESTVSFEQKCTGSGSDSVTTGQITYQRTTLSGSATTFIMGRAVSDIVYFGHRAGDC